VKEHCEVGKDDDTITIEENLTRRMGKRSRSDFSSGPGSSDLDYPMYPLLMIHRLAWRLVSCAAEEAAQCGTEAHRQEAEGDRDHIPRGMFLV
jgi:hypothetical protein